MSNFCEFVDGDMTEEDRKKIDELLIKIAEENELPGKIGKLESENKRLREALAFYAHGKHLWKADERDPACDAYDLVSGRVENGKYAQEVLEGCAK